MQVSESNDYAKLPAGSVSCRWVGVPKTVVGSFVGCCQTNDNPRSDCPQSVAAAEGCACPYRSYLARRSAASDHQVAGDARRCHLTRRAWSLQPLEAKTMIRNPIVWCAWGMASLCAAFMDRDPFLQMLQRF